MTSMVEHQSAKGCFREKGREPGRDDYVTLHLHDDDGGDDEDENTVGKVVSDRKAAESGVGEVEVGIHLQLRHLSP